MSAQIASIGHNGGPTLTIEERLRVEHAEILHRVDQVRELSALIPRNIEDEATAEKTVEIVRSAKRAYNALDDARIAEKKPYLDGSRAVDGFFKQPLTTLDEIAKFLERGLSEFQREKARKEREARLEAERIAKEEAERKFQEALDAERARAPTTETVAALTDAMKAEQEAKAAQTRASATITDLGRVRSAGGTASVSTVWRFEIEDWFAIDLNKLRGHLTRGAIEQAIGDYVRKGGRSLDGVRIYEDVKTVVR